MNAEVKPQTTLIHSVMQLTEKRLLRIFLLGVASGFPWLIIGSLMTAWLKDAGFTRSAIGFFGVIFFVYTVNFAWAPVIDHVRIPLFHRLGQRRSWILLCQLVLIACTLSLSLTGPTVSLTATVVLCFGVAIASATQDLAIDAYRITIIREDEPELIGHAAALATCGWWTGASVAGWAAFLLNDHIGWGPVYFGLALAFIIIATLVLWLFPEPQKPEGHMATASIGIQNWFDTTYLDAVAEFFRRNGVKIALALLLFIFLFKIGEAFLGRMVIVFYKEVGYSDAQIGWFTKGLGWFVTFGSAIAAGIYAARFGVVRGLLFAGIAMAATNLLFAWIAIEGPRTDLYALAVVLDGITSAFSTVAFVTFLSYYTSRLHTATQYGALASIGTAGRTVMAASSGMLVDALGGAWAIFFVITAVMVTPSLLILAWLSNHIKKVTGKNIANIS